jgi:hypothetical protein
MVPELKYDEKGLIPVIIQDIKDNEVLMLAYMNKHSDHVRNSGRKERLPEMSSSLRKYSMTAMEIRSSLRLNNSALEPVIPETEHAFTEKLRIVSREYRECHCETRAKR